MQYCFLTSPSPFCICHVCQVRCAGSVLKPRVGVGREGAQGEGQAMGKGPAGRIDRRPGLRGGRVEQCLGYRTCLQRVRVVDKC